MFAKKTRAPNIDILTDWVTFWGFFEFSISPCLPFASQKNCVYAYIPSLFPMAQWESIFLVGKQRLKICRLIIMTIEVKGRR